MAQDSNNLEQKFKYIINNLPEDKRNALFEKLRAMEPSERSNAIRKIVEAYDRNMAANPPRQVQRPVQRPVQQASAVRSDRRSGENRRPASNISQDDYRSTPAHKESRGRILAVIGILIVFCALCVGIKVFLGDKIEKFISTKTVNSTETAISGSTSEVIPESVITTDPTEPEVTPVETLPTPTPIPLAADHPDLAGLVIVIDPGHQAEKSATSEKVADWLSKEKPGSTPGSVGAVTGIKEYELTLDISLKLKEYLEGCGATVILTREVNDVDITNQERALIAVNNNADIFIRIHADAANDGKSSGVRVFVPDSGAYKGSNISLGDILGNNVAEAIGLEFIGTKATDLYTGLNYANSVPSFQISLGLLSNSNDEAILVNEDNQIRICEAVSEFAAEFKQSDV